MNDRGGLDILKSSVIAVLAETLRHQLLAFGTCRTI
jgi:hypothetical protein